MDEISFLFHWLLEEGNLVRKWPAQFHSLVRPAPSFLSSTRVCYMLYSIQYGSIVYRCSLCYIWYVVFSVALNFEYKWNVTVQMLFNINNYWQSDSCFWCFFTLWLTEPLFWSKFINIINYMLARWPPLRLPLLREFGAQQAFLTIIIGSPTE